MGLKNPLYVDGRFEPHDDTALPPAEPTAAEVAAALARLMAAADRCLAAFYRSARW